MIEEEPDDDEILNKRGITIKSALKNILTISIIMLGAYFMYLGFNPDQYYFLILGFMFICVGTTIMQVKKKPPEPIRQSLTILTCKICGLNKVRNYDHGDAVFHIGKIDKCNKCNELMTIKQIYSVRLKRPIEEKEKEKKESADPLDPIKH